MSSPEISPDSLSWRRLKEDDPEALAYFYDKYADWLLRYGLSVIYNRDIVKDAVQELFLQVWCSRHNLSTADSPKYYLMASVRRLILKTIKEERLLSDQMEERGEDQSQESDDEVHQNVMSAVRSLPSRQQELIFLKFYEKLSYEQIGELTGLDYQVLRNTIHRAVKSLRTHLIKQAGLIVSALIFIFSDFL